MATKAILVTASNVDELNARFFQDGPGVPAAIGYFLVAPFGEDGDYDIVSAANFHSKFIVGNKLHNRDWFEAIPKDIPNGIPLE